MSDLGDDELAEMARDLAVPPCPELRREEMRTSLMARASAASAAPPRRLSRVRWPLAAAAAVLAIALAALSQRAAPPPAARVAATPSVSHHGNVVPHGDARFTLAAAPPDEIVRLTDGTIACEVSPLAPGERFRVVVGDAEIEVRGTSFEVTVAHDRIVSVLVHHGSVEVRPNLHASVWLGRGDHWSAARAAVVAATTTPPTTPAEERPATPLPLRHAGVAHAASGHPSADPAHAAATSPERAVEIAFEEGWDALRRGDAGQAAEAFGRATAAHADSSLSEDAHFWRAVALAQARRAAEASGALDIFLSKFPGSFRAGEAAAMLGWLLLDAGHLDDAEARFRSAVSDRVAQVRRSADAGLAAVDRRRSTSIAPSKGN